METKINAHDLFTNEGLKLRYILIPQLFIAISFLCSLYSTFSCNYVSVHYNQVGELTTEITNKNDIAFGMLAKETSSLDSNQCYWYNRGDLNNNYMMNWVFRVSALSSILGTLLGATNVIRSLFLWCRKVKRSIVQYMYYISAFCILSGLGTQLIFFSGICMFRKCNETLDNIDQSQKSCVDSQCNLGIGFYFSLISTFFWSISLILLLQLLRKSESLYREINKGKEELKCNAEIEEGLHESHGPSI